MKRSMMQEPRAEQTQPHMRGILAAVFFHSSALRVLGKPNMKCLSKQVGQQPQIQDWQLAPALWLIVSPSANPFKICLW